MKTCQGCGKALSFWQRMGANRCAECQKEEERLQAAAEQLAQQHAEERQRVEEENARRAIAARLELRKKCPVCASVRYRVGRLPDAHGSALTGSNRARFRPEENWIEAYALEALACLDCGHVRLFLFDVDRAYLEAETDGKL